MYTNKIIKNTFGDIFPGEDPNIYELILSYDELCSFLDLNHGHPFENVDDAEYMAFKKWFLDECDYHADVECLYDERLKAMDQIEDNDQYWKAHDYMEADIKNEQDLIKITVGREDLVMAFILRWSD